MSTYELSAEAVKWLASGERGMSSEAIFERMTGMPVGSSFGGRRGWAPADPDDLRRCLLLLDAVPEWKTRIAEMADVNRHWRALVAIWPVLVETFEREMRTTAPNAPITYALMRQAEDSAYSSPAQPSRKGERP